MPGLADVRAIAAGDDHSVALKADGTVWAWGDNAHGQLGDGATLNRQHPVQVKGLENVTAIAAGGNHTLALRADGTVWAWGGNANSRDDATPVQVQGLDNVVDIAAGGDFALALKSDHTVLAWGGKAHGQLGDGTTHARPAPMAGGGIFPAAPGAGRTGLIARANSPRLGSCTLPGGALREDVGVRCGVGA